MNYQVQSEICIHVTSVRACIRVVGQYQSRPLPCRSLIDFRTLENAGISPKKTRTHLKILGSKMVTRNKYSIDNPHISGDIGGNAVERETR